MFAWLSSWVSEDPEKKEPSFDEKNDEKTTQMKPRQEHTKPYMSTPHPCAGALVPLHAGVSGPLRAAGKDWRPTSHAYFSMTTNLTRIPLRHACSGDALKSLVYFGKGVPVLVMGKGDKNRFALRAHPTHPNLWIFPFFKFCRTCTIQNQEYIFIPNQNQSL